MISVRLVASSGGKTSGSRLRTEVPLISAPNRRAEKNTPLVVLRPSSATAMPMKPAPTTLAFWMSFVATANCQPRMSITPARPGERAAREHHLHVGPPGVDAAVLRRVGIEADRARLVARDRAVQQHPEHDQGRARDEDPDVQALELGIAPEHGQVRIPDHGVGDRDGLVGRGVRVQRPAEAERPHADPQGDVVEHDRRDHLVRAGGRLEEAGDPAPHRSGERPKHQREDDVQPPGQSVAATSRPGRRRRARRSTGPGRRC